MMESITVLVGNKTFAVYQPTSPIHGLLISFLGIPVESNTALTNKLMI